MTLFRRSDSARLCKTWIRGRRLRLTLGRDSMDRMSSPEEGSVVFGVLGKTPIPTRCRRAPISRQAQERLGRHRSCPRGYGWSRRARYGCNVTAPWITRNRNALSQRPASRHSASPHGRERSAVRLGVPSRMRGGRLPARRATNTDSLGSHYTDGGWGVSGSLPRAFRLVRLDEYNLRPFFGGLNHPLPL